LELCPHLDFVSKNEYPGAELLKNIPHQADLGFRMALKSTLAGILAPLRFNDSVKFYKPPLG